MSPEPRSPATEESPISETSGVASRHWVRGLSRRDQQGLIGIVGTILVTRFMLYATGALVTRMLRSYAGPQAEGFLGRNVSLASWVRWDAAWYLSIAERGYSFDPVAPSNVAFFPLLPLLIKGMGALTDNVVIAGLVVTNLAALGAILALWRWVRVEAGPAAAERAVLWLLVYPFSFFLHSIYAESLFFLLATLALDASSRRQRLAAGLWGGLAATARPMGVLLSPALAWGLWRDWRTGQRLRPYDVIAVFLPAAGLGAYAVYLWVAVGNPLAFWTAHVVGWHVELQWTTAKGWTDTWRIVTRLMRVHSDALLLDSLRVLLPVVFIALTVEVFRHLGGVPGIYATLAVAVGVFLAPDSTGREFLAVTPAFAVLGLTGPRGVVGEALRFLSLGLLLLATFAFFTGRFVS